MDRRSLLTGLAFFPLLSRAAAAQDFSGFLQRLRTRALVAGIPGKVVTQTTAHLTPNARVIDLDHHQPEFTETWAEYESHVLSATRIAAGQQKSAVSRNLLAAITSRFGVPAEPLLGIWGIETNYGKTQGGFDVIDAMTTLAWDRQGGYFEDEVISAMRIIANGDAPASRLVGSYAGAMGQPQFMPSVYLKTAISFTGDGRPDIWGSDADTLASMGNYLASYGWQPGLPSSEPVLLPPGFAGASGRRNFTTLAALLARGVKRLPGAAELPGETPAALLRPDGPGGQSFLIYQNFLTIRRYNASDYYALAVGALGRRVLV
jgi:membrane-bound lytic murein transglycosylase B